jgi:hypothetical protein
MSIENTIATLRAGAAAAGEDRQRLEARCAARVAWVKQTIAALNAADKAVDEAWDRLLDAMPEGAEGADGDEGDGERDPPPLPEEQARDAILAVLKGAADRDRWPRELYWGGI